MKTETIIRQLRRVRQPVEVKLHHCPAWFKLKVAAWMRTNKHYRTHYHKSISALLNDFADVVDWHIDHWGTSHGGERVRQRALQSGRRLREESRSSRNAGAPLHGIG
jgi:hypothetical protein